MVDVVDETQVAAAAKAACEAFKRIDILVNNAGIAGAVFDISGGKGDVLGGRQSAEC